MLVPSIRNWTEATPTLSVAEAVIVMVHERVEPPVGEVMEPDGLVVSGVAGQTLAGQAFPRDSHI